MLFTVMAFCCIFFKILSIYHHLYFISILYFSFILLQKDLTTLFWYTFHLLLLNKRHIFKIKILYTFILISLQEAQLRRISDKKFILRANHF